MPRYSDVSRTHHYALLSVLIGLPVVLLVYLGINLRREFQIERGERLQSAARVAAERINVHLDDLTQHLWSIVSMPAIVETARSGSRSPYDSARVARIDAAWQAGNPDLSLFDTPVSSYLRTLIEGNSTLHELLFTDSLGRLAGANDLTSDYDQADECWFLEWFEGPTAETAEIRRDECGLATAPDNASCETRRCASIGDILLDESADRTGFEVSGPIMADGRAWGAYKALVDPFQLQNYLDAVESTGLAEAYLVVADSVPVGTHRPGEWEYRWRLIRSGRRDGASDDQGADFPFAPEFANPGTGAAAPFDALCPERPPRPQGEQHEFCYRVSADGGSRVVGASRGRLGLASNDWYVALVDSDELMAGLFGARLWYFLGIAALLGFLLSSLLFAARTRRSPAAEGRPQPSA